ncbi:MAG: hypothetical protein J0M08_07300 [Bacteroidetes bacterium]|nr:hypothetical protein [Bacteroidota bacterium]
MKKFFIYIAAVALLSSCTFTSKTMREPNTRLNLEMKDLSLSEQFTAEATSTKIFGIDFQRLFKRSEASVSKDGATAIANPLVFLASIPVIGTFAMDRTSNFAMYELMKAHPGYDVVFYPQFETIEERPIGLRLYRKTTVKVTARLAKMNGK